MKIANWLTFAQQQLEQQAISSARLDAQLLLSHELNTSRAWLLAHPDEVLTTDTIAAVDKLLELRRKHRPLAYIVGVKEFYGRDFAVDEHVLVPRPETEDLVTLCLRITGQPIRVLDLGCGSGVIGLTLALEKPDWDIALSDSSAEALKVARKNASELDISKQPTFRHQDLLKDDATLYDLIVANLPYVPEDMREKPDLKSEPTEALFSGSDGLDHYRQLFASLQTRSRKPQHIVTESLLTQHADVLHLAQKAGYQLHQQLGLAQHFTLL